MSRLIKKTLPNGVYTDYTYDNLSRLTALSNKKAGSEIISNFTYTHDNVGNRLSMATTEGTHNYAYDATYRLTAVDHPAQADEAYSYDKVGNRKTSIAYSNWAYDINNRLTSSNGTTYSYDKNGNTLSRTKAGQVTNYSYDYENRLTRVAAGGSEAIYTYDPFGKRLSKAVDGTTKYYFYDNEDIIAEYDSSGNLIASYIHGQGIDDPISMTRNSNTYYYTFDGLGSVSELTDSTGAVTEAYKYDAFGNLQTPPATGNPYTYTSREYDSETGLYFYRARYYDAQVGRFITADPIGFEGGVNFYVYVENNPINYIDILGLWRSPSNIYDEASRDARLKFPPAQFPGALHNGIGDAYRHCLASCMMARETGQFLSNLLGWLNEKQGDWCHNQERGERKMDDFNNSKGRDFGRTASSTSVCSTKCLNALNRGQLRIYTSNSTSGYWRY